MNSAQTRTGHVLACGVTSAVAIFTAIATANWDRAALLALAVFAALTASSFVLVLWSSTDTDAQTANDRRILAGLAPILLFGFGAGIAVLHGADRLASVRPSSPISPAYAPLALLAGCGLALVGVALRLASDQMRGNDRSAELSSAATIGAAPFGSIKFAKAPEGRRPSHLREDQPTLRVKALTGAVVISAVGVAMSARGVERGADAVAALAIGLVMAVISGRAVLDMRRAIVLGMAEEIIARTTPEPLAPMASNKPAVPPVDQLAHHGPAPMPPAGHANEQSKPAVVARGSDKAGKVKRR